MDSIASVGSVGAGLSQARFQTEYQVRVLQMQQDLAASLGSAALELIRSAVISSGASGHDLDVLA